jgi:hypothetical protein
VIPGERSDGGKRLAVMYVHGVESAGDHYAATAIALLESEFTRIAGVDAGEALAIKPAYWAPVFEPTQTELSRRVGGDRAQWLLQLLDVLAGRASQGSTTALLAAAATSGLRWFPGSGPLHFPTLRWLVVHYLGDAITYQSGEGGDRDHYARVHAVLAHALHQLAIEAGPDAPLCVLGHSLGTVVASDFLADLQKPAYDRSTAVAEELADTAIERGETLGWYYSLGSPLALWAQRHRDFGEPLTVPAPDFGRWHPEQSGEWVNVWDPDDVVSSPLRGLSDRWAEAVREDREVSTGPWWLGWTPLSHTYYWNDRSVVTPIATQLAQAWHRLQDR